MDKCIKNIKTKKIRIKRFSIQFLKIVFDFKLYLLYLEGIFNCIFYNYIYFI